MARRNWVNYALIVTLLAIALAPFVLALGYFVPAALAGVLDSGSHNGLTRVDDHPLDGLEKGPIERALGKFAPRASNLGLILKLMPITILLLSAGLALLLWGMSSSPTAKLLFELGARPPNGEGPENDAVQVLDNLSRNAGVVPPKLYVIPSSFPTTFSDSVDSRTSMVVVTSGVFDLLEPGELHALMAHELCHIANRDSRLDAILAPLGVITEYPFKMFRGQMSTVPLGFVGWRRKLALIEMALSPLGLYIFFVSPILNRLMNVLVLRGREYRADAFAAWLTGNPEGLVYALAKMGGVTTVLKKSTVSGLPAHTSLAQRIERLMNANGTTAFDRLQDAIAKGKRFVADRPGMSYERPGISSARDHLASLNQGHVQGRVYRLVSNEAVPVYEKPGAGAMLLTRVKPGALLVAFDHPGKMRQINTAEEMFGYISRDVKLALVKGVLPQEVYHPVRRAAAEEILARQGELPQGTASAPAAAALSPQQVWMALGFGAAVFAGTSILLFVFVG